jgi:hypothetical protein
MQPLQGKGAGMCTSHPERRTPTFRQFTMAMAAVTWFAIVLPVGARAAGQLVTLADPVTDGKARVVAPGALRVAEYNDPARLPYSDTATKTMQPATSSTSGSFTKVPAGYRLVIETVSASIQVPDGQRAYNVRILIPPLSLPMFFVGGSAATNWYAGSEHVALYVEPEKGVEWTVNRYPNTGFAYISFSLSGHLVKI